MTKLTNSNSINEEQKIKLDPLSNINLVFNLFHLIKIELTHCTE